MGISVLNAPPLPPIRHARDRATDQVTIRKIGHPIMRNNTSPPFCTDITQLQPLITG
jgi:hypothetical protein